MLIAPPLLERIRAACDGPLVLVKGPEIARLYPGGARSFSDVDLLVPDADGVHRALRSDGFVEVDDPEFFRDHHHLRPLKLPSLALKVEIHKAPAWPGSAEPPALGEIVERARPSGLAVEGISTPDPVDHALLLAAHAWVHEPLHTLRDLLDVSAVSAGVATDELERAARAWQIGRIWRTTSDAANALFAAGRPTLPIRTWGRHLAPVRERTVLDNHLQRWLHTFSELPLHSALITVAETLRLEVLPTPEESWHDKLVRVRHAVTHPQAPVSRHTSEWRHEATRRRSQRR